MPRTRRTPPDTWSTRKATQQGTPEHQLWQTLRQDHGLSLADIANTCGVTKQAVKKWMDGTTYPGPDHHPQLLTLLDTGKRRP